MDILTHTLSGLAAGTVMAGFSSGNWKSKTGIMLFSGLGGALPDVDAISMWSKFDGTFGKFFGLEESGRVIYSARHWYSHHSFMHSLLAAFVFAILIWLLFYIIQGRGSKRRESLGKVFYEKQLLLLGFISGFIIHLVQDMITPASSWGGVRLFFPSTVYIGGTGNIWWWNNYNLFLIVVAVLFINSLLLLLWRSKKIKVWKFTMSVFLIGCMLFAWQVKHINYNFNGKKYQDCERKSKEIQKEMLGEKVYRLIERFDNSLKFYF